MGRWCLSRETRRRPTLFLLWISLVCSQMWFLQGIAGIAQMSCLNRTGLHRLRFSRRFLRVLNGVDFLALADVKRLLMLFCCSAVLLALAPRGKVPLHQSGESCKVSQADLC